MFKQIIIQKVQKRVINHPRMLTDPYRPYQGSCSLLPFSVVLLLEQQNSVSYCRARGPFSNPAALTCAEWYQVKNVVRSSPVFLAVSSWGRPGPHTIANTGSSPHTKCYQISPLSLYLFSGIPKLPNLCLLLYTHTGRPPLVGKP